MTEDQIKHMVDRFLMWRLPDDFSPDNGISFDPIAGKGTEYASERKPVGTNLLTATQAEAMVRHMLEGLPDETVEISVSNATYNDVRRALVAVGNGGVILERPLPRRIEMTGVTIVEGTTGDHAPDWPPQASAIGLRDGHRRFGSTGQLFEVRDGRWVRIKKAIEQ